MDHDQDFLEYVAELIDKSFDELDPRELEMQAAPRNTFPPAE